MKGLFSRRKKSERPAVERPARSTSVSSTANTLVPQTGTVPPGGLERHGLPLSDSNEEQLPEKPVLFETGSANQLGLHIVYGPTQYKVDIIFVHGLGGTSHMTWTKNKDPDLFWPATFLSQESDIKDARILTFGYRADIIKSNDSSVLDFAKDLLFEMKYARGPTGNSIGLGKVSGRRSNLQAY